MAPARAQRPGTLARTAVLERVGAVPIACLLVLVLALSLAGLTWRVSPYWGHNAQALARNVGSVPGAAQATRRGKQGADARAAASPAVAPDRISIPKLHAEAPIVDVATTRRGELDVPLDPHVVGWWRYGARPGATTGTAILAGHVNYAGVTGSMAGIGRLDPGDAVYVYGRHDADHRAEVAFRVTGVRTYHKTALPYRQIFDQHSVGRIAIVTCGGPFDQSTGSYLDNIVVFAVPA